MKRTKTRYTPTTTRRISVALSEIIHHDHEGFLDLLSELAVGNTMLMDITWKLVTIDSMNDNSLILEVTGDITEAEKLDSFT